jgi:O-antigen ligase
MLIIDRDFELISSRSIYAAIAFMIVTLISFGFGQLPWYPAKPASIFAQLGQVLIMLISAGAFIVAAHRMENLKWLKFMVFSFIILGGIYVIGFTVPPLRPYANRLFQRTVLDSLFWIWLIALSFGQFWSNKSLKPIWRALFLLIAFAALFTVAVTKQSWVSGWLPALTALFVILFLTRPRIAVISVFVFILLMVIRYQIISNYLFVGDNEYSMLTRLEAWKILFQIIQKNPVFGLGPANYYFYTPFYKILGYSVSFNSHNNYIDLLAQTGILGLGSFFWWTFEIAKTGMQLLRNSLDEFEHSFVVAALGGLAGTMAAAFLGDWVIPFIYNVGMEGVRSSSIGWVFLGSLIFIQVQKKKQVSST